MAAGQFAIYSLFSYYPTIAVVVWQEEGKDMRIVSHILVSELFSLCSGT